MTLRFYSVTLAAIDSPPVSFRGDATSSRPYSPIQSTARVSLASPSRVALLATVYKPRATRHGSRCIVHPTPYLLTPREIHARFHTSIHPPRLLSFDAQPRFLAIFASDILPDFPVFPTCRIHGGINWPRFPK